MICSNKTITGPPTQRRAAPRGVHASSPINARPVNDSTPSHTKLPIANPCSRKQVNSESKSAMLPAMRRPADIRGRGGRGASLRQCDGIAKQMAARPLYVRAQAIGIILESTHHCSKTRLFRACVDIWRSTQAAEPPLWTSCQCRQRPNHRMPDFARLHARW